MPIASLAPGDEHLLYVAGKGGADPAALRQTLPAWGPQEGQGHPPTAPTVCPQGAALTARAQGSQRKRGRFEAAT